MKVNLRGVLTATKIFMSAHRHGILIGAGIIGAGATVAITIPATLKTRKELATKKEEKGEDLTKKETAKIIFKNFCPVAALFTASATAIIAGAKGLKKASVAAGAGLAVAEQYASNLEEAIPKVVGEEKAAEIKKEMVKNEAEKIKEPTEITSLDDNGVYIFREPITGLEFARTPYQIRNAISKFTFNVLRVDGQGSIADLLDFMGVSVAQCDPYTRLVAEGTMLICDGINDVIDIDYKIMERSDGRFGGVIQYDGSIRPPRHL